MMFGIDCGWFVERIRYDTYDETKDQMFTMIAVIALCKLFIFLLPIVWTLTGMISDQWSLISLYNSYMFARKCLWRRYSMAIGTEVIWATHTNTEYLNIYYILSNRLFAIHKTYHGSCSFSTSLAFVVYKKKCKFVCETF